MSEASDTSRAALSANPRVVIKIGSSSLVGSNGTILGNNIKLYAKSIAALLKNSIEVILVSSGAVAAGNASLRVLPGRRTVTERHAAAAVGQALLTAEYITALREENIQGAQFLLSKYDFSVRESYNNALSVLNILLDREVLPIVNQNDTVTLSNDSFGDNDSLAALLAALIHATMLIIITDVDGLYDDNPKKNKNAQRLHAVEKITPEIESIAGGVGSTSGVGGMSTKIKASKLALSLGVKVFIGRIPQGVDDPASAFQAIIEGRGEGSYFGKTQSEAVSRKLQWIAFHSQVAGEIIIDNGAMDALLTRGKSLLPVGIKHIYGEFISGEVVLLKSIDGKILGKGIVNYSSEQLSDIKGLSTQSVKEKMVQRKAEVIHRNDFVMID
jgi:glutamate 5-kinase